MELQEAIKLGIESLVKTSECAPDGGGGTGGDNAKYGIVSKTGKVLYHEYPCHAFVSSLRSPLVFFNRFGSRRVLVEAGVQGEYFSWLLSSDGPWKSFESRCVSHAPFLGSESGDVRCNPELWNFVARTGWVWSDLDHPVNLQHSFLVASRMPAEWPGMVMKWSDWNKRCNPENDPFLRSLLFVFVVLFHSVKDSAKIDAKDTGYFWLLRSNKYDYPVDHATYGEEYIRNFCSGTVDRARLMPNFSETAVYTPVNAIWGTEAVNPTDNKAYPNVIFELYRHTHGLSQEACEEFWKKRLGFDKYNYEQKWAVTEDEVLEIAVVEAKRLQSLEEKKCLA